MWEWGRRMATIAQGKTEFSARLQRIEKRGAGVTETFNAQSPRSAVRRMRKVRGGAGRRLPIMKLPLALSVGALSYLAALYGTFLIGDLPPEFSNPDYILAGQAAMSLFVVFVARMFFGLTAKTHFVLSLVGLAAAMSLMHNLVHMAPEPWAELFSPGWVNEILTSTKPDTLHFRNIDYPLDALMQKMHG